MWPQEAQVSRQKKPRKEFGNACKVHRCIQVSPERRKLFGAFSWFIADLRGCGSWMRRGCRCLRGCAGGAVGERVGVDSGSADEGQWRVFAPRGPRQPACRRCAAKGRVTRRPAAGGATFAHQGEVRRVWTAPRLSRPSMGRDTLIPCNTSGCSDGASRGLSRRRLGTFAGAGDALVRCRRVARPRCAVYTSQAGPRRPAVQAGVRCPGRRRDRPLLAPSPRSRGPQPPARSAGQVPADRR
jgi:hypothetical protein